MLSHRRSRRASSSNHIRHRRIRIELLEDRRVLSVLTPQFDLFNVAPAFFVDAQSDANDPDGRSWDTALPDLQVALAEARRLNSDGELGNNITTIYVAQGLYYTTPDGDRAASFGMVSGVSVLGGYAGVTSPEAGLRDLEAYKTILSGDIGEPDDTSDNAYHVVTNSAIDVIIDGVIVTGGNANCSGGGILNNETMTIRNSIITGNRAAQDGGGIYNNGTLTVANVSVSQNSAAREGGGIANDGGLTLTNVTLAGNSATTGGGASVSAQGTVTMNNSIVALNSSTTNASDFYVADGSVNGRHNLVRIGPCNGLLQGVGGNLVGDVLLPIDPMFRDPTSGDFRPQQGAPGIDAGDNFLAIDGSEDAMVRDVAGALRFVNATVDMGAFEFQSSTSIVVNTLGDTFESDDGLLSLREAITVAQPGETITFAPSLAGETIVLRGEQLVVAKSLTIDASGLKHADGQPGITLDANQGSRVFLISGDTNGDNVINSIDDIVTVSIVGVTITGGLVADPSVENSGAGILSNATMLSVIDCVIRENRARQRGGGLYNSGIVNISNTVFEENSAYLVAESGDGGGIYSAGRLSASHCRFTGNVAGRSGGAIYDEHGVAVLSHSQIKDNRAHYRDGGGVRSWNRLQVIRSLFANNGCNASGGAVYAGNRGLVTYSHFVGNGGGSFGGAVRLNGGEMRSCYVGGNRAGTGGAVFLESSGSKMSDTLVENNIASRAVVTSFGHITIDGSIVKDNTGWGVVVRVHSQSDTVIVSSVISDNPGGVSNQGRLRMSRSMVLGNGIGIENQGILHLTNSVVAGNSNSNGKGGGIRNSGGMRELTVVNSTITGNSAAYGGGIYHESPMTTKEAIVFNTIIAQNRAAVEGAEIFVADGNIAFAHSLIGVGDNVLGLMDGSDGNLVGSSEFPRNPMFVRDTATDGPGDFGDLRLRFQSPAVDGGSNELAIDASGLPLLVDIRGEGFPRITSAAVDIGAYELEYVAQVPIANAGGPYEGFEGVTLELDASASINLGGGALVYRWDLDGNGQWDTEWLSEPTINYKWDDDWTGIVHLEVANGELTDTSTADVVIQNVAPEAMFSSDGAVTYGEQMAVEFKEVFDPSMADTEAGFHYAFGFNEEDFESVGYALASGSTIAPFWTLSNLEAGQYTIYGRVIDKDDGFTQYQTTVTVERAPLTITVLDALKVYGEPNPVFSVNYEGFVLDQDASVLSGTLTFETVATESSDVGMYPVSASGLESDNYEITFVNGWLTILKAPQTIHWDDPEPILQGTPLSETQLNATVTVVGPSPAGELTYDPPAGTLLPAGFHVLTVTAAETLNYLPASATVPIIVSGASLVDGTLWIVGTLGDDWVHINGHGRNQIRVHTNFYPDHTHQSFSVASIDRIVAHLLDGDDHMTIAGNVTTPTLIRGGSGSDFIHTAGGPAILIGGTGNDVLQGGAGRNILIGGGGSDTLKAGRSGDVLVGGSANLDDDDQTLFDLLARWNSNESLQSRMDHIIDSLIVEYDDEEQNALYGGAGHDLIFADLDDLLRGNQRAYTVVR
jgi:hypothetical protein